jgi:hypothetical protein
VTSTLTRRRADFGLAAPLTAVAGFTIGALVAQRSSLGNVGLAACFGAALVVVLAATLRVTTLVVLLVVSTELTRARFPFGGFHFLPEHVMLVALLLALVVRATAMVVRPPAAYEMLLLAWIAWNLAVTRFYSVDVAKSVAIVAWMALAWLILWCVRSYFLADPEGRERVLDLGLRLAAILGAVSFALWAVALLGGTRFGVQPEFNTGTLAAKGLTLEANFLGSQELCWLFLMLRRRIVDHRPMAPWEVVGLLLGIVASMTRAVWIATILVAVGAAIVARRGDVRASTLRSPVRQTIVAGMVMSLLLLALGGPAVQKLRASLDFGSTTARGRVANWELARDDLASSDAYLTGFGTNAFGQHHRSATLKGQPDYLGNLPLTVLYDSGIIGVIVFGAAMTGIILAGRDRRSRWLNLLFVLALMIVGAATSPVWFGFLWVTVAAFDTAPVPVTTPAREAGSVLLGHQPLRRQVGV